MAKASKKATPKKPRTDKYDEKLAVKGKFADAPKVIKNKEDKKKPAANDFEDYQESDERELGGEG